MIETKKPGGSVDIRTAKAFSKEQRVKLANEIRKDADLWNVVHGIGGLSNKSNKGRLQGVTTLLREVVKGAKIEIIDSNENVKNVATNQNGYYKIDLEPGEYEVVMKNAGNISEEMSVIIIAGQTSTLNYNFDNQTT